MLLDEIKFGTKNTFVIKAKGALQKTLQCFNAESVEKLFGQPVTIQPMMGDTVVLLLPNCNRPAPPCAADLSQKPTATPPTFKIIPAVEMEAAAAAAGGGNDPNNNEKKDDSKKDGQ
uniref:Uncharacterized protein n=1 Tax=Panagrolaimus davidi TaxID=227884 RepID=A0A914Q9X0_9BILA